MMTRRQVIAWSFLLLLLGGSLLVYLVFYVPPTTAEEQINGPALVLFFITLFASVTGIGTLVALALHRRWPMLAGGKPRHGQPAAGVALRQGFLLSLALGIVALLALLQRLDPAFVLVTFVLAGLLEAFLQSRQ